MKISKIKIHNYRSIHDGEFFLNDYSVLVGENNSGKSNIISAIRTFYGDLKFDERKDFPKFPKASINRGSYIEITFQLNEKELNSIDAKYKRTNGSLILRKDLFTNKTHALKNEKTPFDEEFYGAKGVADGKIGKVIYIPSVNRTEDILKTSGISPFRDILNYVVSDIIEKNPQFSKVNDQLVLLKDSLLNHKNDNGDSIETIQRKVQQELSSWKNINFEISINRITSDMILKNLVSPVLFDKKISSEIDIDKFGQGFQRSLIFSLIKIDTEIKQSRKISTHNDKVRKVFSPNFTFILFEEPEAFLHYTQKDKMQTNLTILSKEENKQVLISTHSNFFTSRNIEDLTNIIKLENQGSTSVNQITTKALEKLLNDNSNLSEILGETPTLDADSESLRYFLWLNQDRTSIFFSNHVLLVEGQTEKLFLDYMLNNDWNDIKPSDICIIDANGKYNIVRFMNLLSSFKIKHFVLFDEDDNKGKHSRLNEYINTSQNEHTQGSCTFSKDIESFLNIEKEKDKPLGILYKFKHGQIDFRLIFKLKLKLKKLFLGKKRFAVDEKKIRMLIEMHQNFVKLSGVSISDNGEWNYKYNLANDFFTQFDFRKSYLLEENYVYRFYPDNYYIDICTELTQKIEYGFYPFYELLTQFDPQDDEWKKVIEEFESLEEMDGIGRS